MADQRKRLIAEVRAVVDGAREVEQLTQGLEGVENQTARDYNDPTRNVQRGLRNTQQETRETADVVSDLRGTLGTLAGVLGAGALGGKLLRTANEMEQVHRQAEALGASVQNFSELTFTFREYGLQQDDVSDALGTLSDRAEDASSGMKSFIEDFQLLNVEVEDLRGKSPEQLFELVADRVSKIEDPTERAAGVVRLFGDDLGRRLLPMLIKGTEELERNAEKAREVGAAYDEDAAAGAAEASRALREVSEIFDAQFTELVADNADALVGVAEALGFIVEKSGSVLSFFEQLSKGLAITLANAQGYEATVTGQIDQAEGRLDTLQGARERQLENIQRLQDEGTGGPVLEELRKGLEETESEIEQVEKKLKGLRAIGDLDRSGSTGSGTGGDGDSGDDDGGGGDDTVRVDGLGTGLGFGTGSSPAMATGGMAPLDPEFQQMLKEASQLVRDTRTETERYNATVARYDELLEVGAISQETYNRAVANAREKLKEASDEAEDAGERMSEFAKSAAQNIQSSFADFLADADTDFGDFADSFADAVQRMVAEASSARLMEALFGEDGSGLSGGDGGYVGAFVNALLGSSSSSGGGSDFAGVMANVQHGGGLVSSAGTTRHVPADLFAGAQRLHTGGIPSIRSNEVPTILEDDEEVLARNDPRHRANGGGGAPAVTVNVTNEGTAQEVDGEPQVSGGPEGLVIDILTKDQKDNGPITRGFGAVFDLRRGGG